MKVMLPVTKNLDCVALFVFPVEPKFSVSPPPPPVTDLYTVLKSYANWQF